MTFMKIVLQLLMESMLYITEQFQKGYFMQNRLETLRKERGIRQEELARALQVSRQTIGSIENGRYNPSIILAIRISRYFQIPVEEIFIYSEES